MKKILLRQSITLCLVVVSTLFYAQDYKMAGGLFVDTGNGTGFGPHVKFFPSTHFSIQPAVLFADGTTVAGADFSYNDNFPGAAGLMWNIGVGPQMWFGGGSSIFVVRPSAGLEYTIPSAPINLFFDWRPALVLSDGSDFTAGRFGLGLRYIFKR